MDTVFHKNLITMRYHYAINKIKVKKLEASEEAIYSLCRTDIIFANATSRQALGYEGQQPESEQALCF